VLGFWILYQVYAVAFADPDEPTAWWSHIGGLVAGAALVPFFRRRGVPLFDRGTGTLAAPVPEVDGPDLGR
jgi:membrane associated rhomboid family serine protease